MEHTHTQSAFSVLFGLEKEPHQVDFKGLNVLRFSY